LHGLQDLRKQWRRRVIVEIDPIHGDSDWMGSTPSPYFTGSPPVVRSSFCLPKNKPRTFWHGAQFS
jgi:hypothetical protein